jgi:hypothetical protein
MRKGEQHKGSLRVSTRSPHLAQRGPHKTLRVSTRGSLRYQPNESNTRCKHNKFTEREYKESAKYEHNGPLMGEHNEST